TADAVISSQHLLCGMQIVTS
ncbi:hypothetical protein D021_3295B, partial [Vibrio parahaemolyticus 10296]